MVCAQCSAERMMCALCSAERMVCAQCSAERMVCAQCSAERMVCACCSAERNVVYFTLTLLERRIYSCGEINSVDLWHASCAEIKIVCVC